jgi:phage regulator Rha-like protein
LAHLYGVETGQLKRAVKRNLQRFPEDFMFTLSSEEYRSLRCQIGTLNRGAHAKYLPYAFTQEGVAMLSGILNSQRAIQMNIQIMRAFIRLREYLIHHKQIAAKFEELEGRLSKHDNKIQSIIQAIQQLLDPSKKRAKRIGFMQE